MSNLSFATDCAEKLLKLTNAPLTYKLGKDSSLKFSYEVEFYVLENLKILDFYRVKDYRIEDWISFSEKKKIELAKKAIEKYRKQGQVPFIKLDFAPDFLADRLVVEEKGKVEMSLTRVTEDLREIESDLEWIWKNIGEGSVQGHVSAEKEYVRVNNVKAKTKIDYDIAQAQSLSYGWKSYKKNKSKIPGNNLSHHSLGPVNEDTLKAFEKVQSKGKAISTFRTKNQLKYIYGPAYRPDLYGSDRVGIELRQCHKRLNCIQREMRKAAQDFVDDFSTYSFLDVDSHVVSQKLFDSLSEEKKKVFERISEIVKVQNYGALSTTPFHLRFLFAEIDWSTHPLIKLLDQGVRDEFNSKLTKALKIYEKKLKKIKISDENVLAARQMQLILAEFSSNSGLSEYLEKGLEIAKNYGAVDFLPNMKSGIDKNIKNTQLRRLFARGYDYNKILTIVPIAKNTNLKKQTDLFKIVFNRQNEEARDLLFKRLSNSAFNGIFTQPTGRLKFLKKFFSFEEKYQITLIDILNISGTKTTVDNQDGSWAFRKLENKNEVIEKLLDLVISGKVSKEEMANVFKARSISHLDSKLLENENDTLSFISLFNGSNKKDSTKWIMNYLNNNKSLKNKEDKNFYNILVANVFDKVVKISDGKYYVANSSYSGVLRVSSFNKLRISAPTKKELVKIEVLKSEEKLIKASKKVKLSEIDLLFHLRSNPNSVYVISARSIHHQGLVIGDTVYSIVNSSGITKLPVENWVGKWGNSTLVELNLSIEKKQALLEQIESEVGKAKSFAIGAAEGKFNCTNMVSCQLEAQKILDFPNEYVRSDSKGQLKYLLKSIDNDNRIKRIYIRNKVPIDVYQVMKVYVYGFGIFMTTSVAYNIYEMLNSD